MIISDFTKPELDYFRTYCNFTKDEAALFEYRVQGLPLETCAEMMCISVSTVKRISRKVNSKIMRAC